MCEMSGSCPFFNDRMDNMPSVSDLFKNKYCKNDKNSCARYKVAQTLGRDKVPIDLFPNDVTTAENLIKAAK